MRQRVDVSPCVKHFDRNASGRLSVTLGEGRGDEGPKNNQGSRPQDPRDTDVRAGDAVGLPSDPGPDGSDPALQPGLHILQRVRPGFEPGAAGRHAEPDRPAGGFRHDHHHAERRRADPASGSRCIIRHIRERGAIATLITNGLLLTPERIREPERAGLDYLQISIDNVTPGRHSKKSLQVLDLKLRWLAEHAEFGVTINSVLGAGIRNPEDALQVSGRARELGFNSTVGVLHDNTGQLTPLTTAQQTVYEQFRKRKASLFSFSHFDSFQDNISRGLANEWHCRAGGRFLYICEDGLVHYCSQQRGRPGIPLEDYTVEDLRREAARPKGCAPFCTISCVHQTAMLDDFRERPRETLAGILDRRRAVDPAFQPPAMVGLLGWLFLHDRRRGIFGKVVLNALGLKGKPAARPPN